MCCAIALASLVLEIEMCLEVADDAADHLLSVIVQDALSQPDDDHRAILDGVHLQGHTLADVASHLDVPVDTVKSRVFYADGACAR